MTITYSQVVGDRSARPKNAAETNSDFGRLRCRKNARMKIDGFLMAMLAVIGFAFAWPELGASGGPLPVSLITGIGISVVFFLHGAGLSREALSSGATNWRLHLLIQSCTFLFFPALGAILMVSTTSILPLEARMGLFFLCVLSSTISSSIALVAMARGNVSAAVFNASLSGIIGMILTPMLMAPVIGAHLAGQQSLLSSIFEIAAKLLLPFAAGHMLRPLLAALLAKRKKWVGRLDRGVILMIVYASFCQSTADGLWSRYDPTTIAILAGFVALLLVLVLTLARLFARLLGFNREDEITAVFCGSTKSLANGAPIAQTLFGGNPAMGMILLPLMIYHQLQIIVCTLLAQRYAASHELGLGPILGPGAALPVAASGEKAGSA